MADREAKKDAARQRREAEEADRLAASRRKRIQLVAGGGFAIVAIVGVGLAFALGGGGDDAEPGEGTPQATQAAIPEVRTTDLQAAAKLAKGRFTSYRYDYGTGNHVTTTVKYPQNPPTNGPHHPTWASDGNYAGVATPQTEKIVHALEHGRIEIQYRPGLPAEQVAQLEALYDEAPYHVLLFENATGMKGDVAVTAWSHGLIFPTFGPEVFDAIRAFRETYRDKGPELVP